MSSIPNNYSFDPMDPALLQDPYPFLSTSESMIQYTLVISDFG